MQSHVDAERISGVVMAIARNGRLVYSGMSTGDIRSLEGFVDELATKPRIFQPGTRWMYGMSTDVLGFVVEVVSGKPFQDSLVERITGPLGMGLWQTGTGLAKRAAQSL